MTRCEKAQESKEGEPAMHSLLTAPQNILSPPQLETETGFSVIPTNQCLNAEGFEGRGLL